MKQKKGISLIVLVITIIVVIILAAAVILTINKNNPIENAKEATFKGNIAEYNSELSLWISNQYVKAQTVNFDPDTINKTGAAAKSEGIISSLKDTDTSKFEIQSGKLVFVGTDDTEKSWTQGVGIKSDTTLFTYAKANVAVAEGSTGISLTENSTIDGISPTYSDPVIPAGFFAVNTDSASWNNVTTDWNNGLVIQDTAGNQFVWVPVDGTNVAYAKWCTTGIVYNNGNLSDDTLPADFDASKITNTYKGFYIARYEASFDYNNGTIRAKSIKSNGVTNLVNWSTTRDATYNGYLWNSINYTDSQTYANNMATSYGYDATKVGTNLITGTEWDTIMKWIQNSGYNVTTDSTAWGNYSNASFTYEYPAPGTKAENISTLFNTGAAIRNRAKNIYDLAGNLYEWTNEKYLTTFILRGGRYSQNGYIFSPALRPSAGPAYVNNNNMGFRIALYIK